MCRLLGVIVNKPVHFEFSCSHFKPLGARNPHGWGIGWYDKQGNGKVKKEAIRADISKNYDYICHKIHSHLIIEHVRLASCGDICTENSHPFKFNNWIFAHNGGVDKKSLLKSLKPEYHDRLFNNDKCTDSEVYFHFLLQNIDENNGDIIKGICYGLEKIQNELGHGGLNFLLSDGKRLYAYRNGNSLYFLERNHEDFNDYSLFEQLSKETQLLIRSKSLNREKAVIICSEEISDEPGWELMENGQLLIIDKNLNIQEELI